MDFFVTISQDEDGVYIADCPSIPGCVSQGETEAKAVANIREAIKECLVVRRQRGMPLTVDVRRVQVET
ncbi:MAG: type II toxin-antitoxin system HicB family antitoxin [Armatimonadota bacterium]|nr:type II toxin-antitoxin system HicB family antitoxin [Armatimonadota bacterium]